MSSRVVKIAFLISFIGFLVAQPSFSACQECEYELFLGVVCSPLESGESGRENCDDRLGQCRLFGDSCQTGGGGCSAENGEDCEPLEPVP